MSSVPLATLFDRNTYLGEKVESLLWRLQSVKEADGKLSCLFRVGYQDFPGGLVAKTLPD